MNISEAKRKLGLTYQGIYRASSRGNLKYTIVDGQKEFSIEDIRAYSERVGKGNRVKGVDRKVKFIPATYTRPSQKTITDEHGNETTLSQCKNCREFKTQLYQYDNCAICLHPVLKKLVVITNQVRGLVK